MNRRQNINIIPKRFAKYDDIRVRRIPHLKPVYETMVYQIENEISVIEANEYTIADIPGFNRMIEYLTFVKNEESEFVYGEYEDRDNGLDNLIDRLENKINLIYNRENSFR